MSEDELRTATPDDYQEMFRIACLLHKENGQHPFSERKVCETIWRGVNRAGAISAVVGGHADIKAMILMTIEEPYYSDSKILVERWNYVRPDCRKTDYAKRMIAFAKKCADETGLFLSIGVISDTRLDAKRRLYERMLPIGGYWFTYRPSAVDAVMRGG